MEGEHDAAAASAPTPLRVGAPSSKGKGIEGLAQSQKLGGHSASDERRGSPITGRSRGNEGSSPPVVREPSVHTQAPTADFLAADSPPKRALVKKLAKSWSLAPVDSVEIPAVDEEHVAMAKVRLNL